MLLFFGVMKEYGGHDMWVSETERLDPFWIDGVWQFQDKRRITIPWNRVHAALCPGKRSFDEHAFGEVAPEHQREGEYSLHHAEGWTALAWWDRSMRCGYWSNSALFTKGHVSASTLLERGRETFPERMAKIAYQFKVGRFSRPPLTKPTALVLTPLAPVEIPTPTSSCIGLAKGRHRPVHNAQVAFAW